MSWRDPNAFHHHSYMSHPSYPSCPWRPSFFFLYLLRAFPILRILRILHLEICWNSCSHCQTIETASWGSSLFFLHANLAPIYNTNLCEETEPTRPRNEVHQRLHVRRPFHLHNANEAHGLQQCHGHTERDSCAQQCRSLPQWKGIWKRYQNKNLQAVHSVHAANASAIEVVATQPLSIRDENP